MDIEKVFRKNVFGMRREIISGITVEELYLTYMVEEKLMREGEKKNS